MVDNGNQSLKQRLQGFAVLWHGHLTKGKTFLFGKNTGCGSCVISEKILLQFDISLYMSVFKSV